MRPRNARIDEPPAALGEVEQADEDRLPLSRQEYASLCEVQGVAGRVAGLSAWVQSAAPRLGGPGEDDQRRHLLGMKGCDAHAAQRRAAVAQQAGRGGIGVADRVGDRISTSMAPPSNPEP